MAGARAAVRGPVRARARGGSVQGAGQAPRRDSALRRRPRGGRRRESGVPGQGRHSLLTRPRADPLAPPSGLPSPPPPPTAPVALPFGLCAPAGPAPERCAPGPVGGAPAPRRGCVDPARALIRVRGAAPLRREAIFNWSPLVTQPAEFVCLGSNPASTPC